jgi:hypothetical protein
MHNVRLHCLHDGGKGCVVGVGIRVGDWVYTELRLARVEALSGVGESVGTPCIRLIVQFGRSITFLGYLPRDQTFFFSELYPSSAWVRKPTRPALLERRASAERPYGMLRLFLTAVFTIVDM